MNVITQNPFRVLGLLSNSPERVVQRQLTKITLSTGIGKTVAFDDDFSVLGSINRTAMDVQRASSQLEQVRQKVLYALFWFTNNNPVDEIALAHLRSGNTQKAGEVWVWCAPYLGPLTKLDNGLNLDPYERQDQAQVYR